HLRKPFLACLMVILVVPQRCAARIYAAPARAGRSQPSVGVRSSISVVHPVSSGNSFFCFRLLTRLRQGF
ncbi:MAG TPA: hypothetical protein VJ124_19305, partial [Pyrinomonadaceae bacterium]|nr:hypothetical protein [Pyrinomonadaceae bacterium]